MGESEFRSNGKLTKDFHPHHTWNHVTWLLDFVFFYIFCALWQWTRVSPGQMVNSQRTFIHIPHGIVSREIWTLCFLYILCIAIMDESESRSNGKLTKDFHPPHTWGLYHVTFGLCVFFVLRSQIKLLTCEKAGSYEKAGHVFFIVQLFLDSNFL